MKRFNPSSSHPERAAQAWQVLVAAAMARRTLTYQELGQSMYRKKAAGVLDRVLGHIAYYCRDNGLPILTSIVVGKERGTPGRGIPLGGGEPDKERESVYAEDWFDIYPPTPDALAKSYAANVKK